MSSTFATLRKPDATDIEALRVTIGELSGRNLPQSDINEMLAASLRVWLKPEYDEEGDADKISAAAAPASTSVAHHHFTLPEHLGHGQLRTVVREGEPWFVAADVAVVLGIGRTDDAVARLDDDEKGADSIRTPGGEQTMTVINESGLFSLVLTSRKPQAKPFKRWVTHEVLPSISRTGGYQDDDGAMDGLLRAATNGQLGTAKSASQPAPAAPTTPSLPPDLQMLLALLLPMFAELAPHLKDWLAAWLDKRTRTLLPRTRPAYADLPFFDLLNGRCKVYGRTYVARELGVSLPQISQVLNFSGAYGDGRASPHTLAEKVLAAYGGVATVQTPAQAALL